MTVTLDLPADLQGKILARAAMNGSNVEEMIVILLRESVVPSNGSQRLLVSPQPLQPGIYPDEAIPDVADYRPVPLSNAGVVTAHLIPAGRLMPATFPDTE